MYIQEKNTTEDLAVWARPFAFHSYGEFTKKKKKNVCTVNSTSGFTLWTLCYSYYKGISDDIDLKVYSVT
jgi:hypothetical protein